MGPWLKIRAALEGAWVAAVSSALVCGTAAACGDTAGDPPVEAEPDASRPTSSGPDSATDAQGAVPDALTDALGPDSSDASPPLFDQASPPTTIAIVNPGFELPVTGPNTFVTNAAPSGWQAYGSAIDFGARTVGVLNPNTSALYVDPVPEGRNVGVVFLMDNLPVATEAGLQQTLTERLSANTTYTLRVDVGNIAPASGVPYAFGGFPGYRIELLAGGEVLASDNGTLQPGEGRYLRSTVVAPIGAGHPRVGQALGIRLVNVDGPAGIEVNFDDVRLSAQRR